MGKHLNGLEYHVLDWDTKYFKIPSGKIIFHEEIDIDNIKECIRKLSDCKFITIVNEYNNNMNNANLARAFGKHIFLVDVNVQFNKEVQSKSSELSCIYTKKIDDLEEMKKIASDSYQHSRFFNDLNLDYDLSRKVYSHWVNSSYDDSSKFYLIHKENNQVASFIIYYFDKRKNCIIDLIAVSKKYQNKGLGTKMIKELESHISSEHGSNQIFVGTQINNIGGINFYTKCGFKIQNVNSIYHYWN